MQYRELGQTGLRVSAVGFGAWAIGGGTHGSSYGPTDDAVSAEAVRVALDMGCTFFDTADVYGHGHSETVLGRVIGNRPDVIVSTKVGANFYGRTQTVDFSDEYISLAVERSLQRLRRDAVDICLLHNPGLEVIAQGEGLEALLRLREQGKIRYVGVSVHDPVEGLAALGDGRCDVIQVPLHLCDQRVLQAFLPLADRRRVGIVARETLWNGILSGRYSRSSKFHPSDFRSRWSDAHLTERVEMAQALRFLELPSQRSLAQAAVRFVLDQPGVSVALVGAKTPGHVRENMKAIDVPPLTEDELRDVRSLLLARLINAAPG